MSTKQTVVAVKPETLLVPLPEKPSWFDKELAKVATRDGRPVFKIVDGQRELKWRNGKRDIKHLLQHDEVPAYLPVVRQVFRRMDTKTWKPKYYSTKEAAQADPQTSLERDISWTNVVSTRAVGRACWIVEVYVSPEELGYENWQAGRYADLQVKGVYQKVDLLGPFPRDGYYVYCFSVLDEDGNAISPNQKTIEECQKRWKQMLGESNTSLEEEILGYDKREEEFEKKEVARISDNVYQFHGIAARTMFHGAAASKPITKVYE
jgi:hypothetical protein